MTGKLQGRTEAGTWVQGVTSVYGQEATYPFLNKWHELVEGQTGPAQWTFDADAQGWTDNGGRDHPAEWQAADGRILGEASGPPNLYPASSTVYSPSFRPIGPGPFKVRATCAALQTGGTIASGDEQNLRFGFWLSAWMGGDEHAVLTSPVGGSTGWEVHESDLWTPTAEWLANPNSTIQVMVEVVGRASLFGGGNAEWRVQLNDATVLNADGSVAQRIVTPSKVGKAWDGTRWVDFT